MRRREFLYLSGMATAAMRTVPVAARSSQDGNRLPRSGALITARDGGYHVRRGVQDRQGRPSGASRVRRDQRRATLSQRNPGDSVSHRVDHQTVAATAIMRLVQDGKVSVEAPVRKYLPDFVVKDETAAASVTVAHLLSHTPGWEGQLSTDDRGAETLARFTSGLRDLPQMAAPGAVWSYNNAGFGVAGRIIEVVTGKTIHDALRDLVFAPIGLPHAFTRTGTAMTYRFAVGHRQQKSGQTEVIRPFELPVNVTAGGGAMSIASLLQYAGFHLSGKTDAGQPLLSAAAADADDLRHENATTDDGPRPAFAAARSGSHYRARRNWRGPLSARSARAQGNLAFGILTNHAGAGASYKTSSARR
jgi:CubicO group peptidase (beta-lactamase class C family)